MSRLIDPSVTLIKESDPFKKIERIGRTCYKSEDKITEDSAKKFYSGLVKRQHTAMVEHATFVFQTDRNTYYRYTGLKYFNYTQDHGRYLISANLRALNESGEPTFLKALYKIDPQLVYCMDELSLKELIDSTDDYFTIFPVDLTELKDVTVNEFMAHAYFTFHFICDRGVTHEIVRHRPASYAQESTRYCNYTKDKFGGEITFIKPAHWDSLPDHIKFRYLTAFDHSEEMYNALIESGQAPQQARAVLPNALKTELIMTTNAREYEHFFNLRSRGTTGAPHPDMKVVADKALAMYEFERMAILGI